MTRFSQPRQSFASEAEAAYAPLAGLQRRVPKSR